jgi:hypothetical protein
MQLGMIHKLIDLFSQAFDQLEVRVSMDWIEHLSVMVHKAMTVQARNFHNLEHVFNFTDQTNPIQQRNPPGGSTGLDDYGNLRPGSGRTAVAG